MSEEIKYDFILSRHTAEELETSVDIYEKVVVNGFTDDIELIRHIWQGEFADEMYKKCIEIHNGLKHIQNEMLCVIDEIDTLSRRMHIIEDEAAQIARKDSE